MSSSPVSSQEPATNKVPSAASPRPGRCLGTPAAANWKLFKKAPKGIGPPDSFNHGADREARGDQTEAIIRVDVIAFDKNSLAVSHRAREELNGNAERAARCLLI